MTSAVTHTSEKNTVLLCLYVADPATFLAYNSVLVIYFPLRAASLFISGKKTKYYYLINIINIESLSLKLKLIFCDFGESVFFSRCSGAF